MAKELLDLHGFKIDDVIAAVDRFLTQANAAELDKVRIMTGKGTGAVQKQVIQLLKQAHYSWKFEKLANGKPNEGVLVVHLG
ncbi:MAG: Smr/MutS family protein [Bdellovibrionales bacterium]|nr:Smr/MutS family protein [Oligoflexia bacterium]